MKKIIFYSLIFVLFFVFGGFFSSCASLPSDSSHIEKKQSEKKLRFDDWKYMGFGSQIPVWVEPALDGNIARIKKLLPELADKELLAFSAAGINIDQAEIALSELEVPEAFSLYEAFWVRQTQLSDKPYIAIAIYKKD